MKRREILLVGLCTLICTAISTIYFHDEITDKYYELKYPPVTEYYEVIDGKWTETQDSSIAEYFRRISYDENNSPVGMVRDYFISGAIQWRGHVLSVKPFIRQGKCEWFYENGNLKRSGVFESNKENGAFARYYETGAVKEQGYKIDDKLEGGVTAYYENGQVQYSGNFSGDLTNGIFSIYKQDGTPLPQKLYGNDTILLVAFNIQHKIDDLGETEAISVGEYYLGGEYYLEQNDYVNAIEYYSEAINSYENYTQAYHQRGIAYYYNNQFNEAISDFNSGISLGHPEKYHLKYLVGSCKMYQEEVDTAITIFHEAVAMCPQNISGNKTTSLAYNRIGDIYLDSEQYTQAIHNYSSAIKADPENSKL